ncbi:hypothetical protein MTR_5g078560 [Medicago truncatula]|uniref:Uncharacterized protein n=1 Tax=Medicago truncatula TaxID=3880 RepID=G7K1S3_MEDTR|nr:hypothetical protein MTR_5g078560 [Medicago truncatula]
MEAKAVKCLEAMVEVKTRLRIATILLHHSHYAVISTKLWSCNFNSQLAKALSIEGDYRAPPPIDVEWLPKSVVDALVDLIVVVFGIPKGLFKVGGKRSRSGMR